jgi:cytochrome c553
MRTPCHLIWFFLGYLHLFRHASSVHNRPMPTTSITFAALFASSLALAAPAPALRDDIATRALACAACHGKEGRASNDGFFPRIAGKPAGYLYQQLLNFREGRRRYPAMNYLVAHLSDDYLREMAGYFAALHPPYPAARAPEASPSELEAGRQLVLHGDQPRGIPACVACHGARLTGVQPAIPGLLGLPRDYLSAQFGAWKTGARRAAEPDCMRHTSGLLTPQDIRAVAAWLSSQPPPANMAPAASLPGKLPLACGSQP